MVWLHGESEIEESISVKSKGKGSPVNGGWKESSGEGIRGIRSGAGNERKGGKAKRVACIIFDKDNPQDMPDARTELNNRLESLGKGVEDVSV